MITLVEGKHPLHFEGKHLSFLHHKIVSVEFSHNLLVREIHPSLLSSFELYWAVST